MEQKRNKFSAARIKQRSRPGYHVFYYMIDKQIHIMLFNRSRRILGISDISCNKKLFEKDSETTRLISREQSTSYKLPISGKYSHLFVCDYGYSAMILIIKFACDLRLFLLIQIVCEAILHHTKLPQFILQGTGAERQPKQILILLFPFEKIKQL